MTTRITTKQREALDLLRNSSAAGVLSASHTTTIMGRVWVHWRTAYSLEEKGLARIDRHWEVVLTREGQHR